MTDPMKGQMLALLEATVASQAKNVAELEADIIRWLEYRWKYCEKGSTAKDLNRRFGIAAHKVGTKIKKVLADMSTKDLIVVRPYENNTIAFHCDFLPATALNGELFSIFPHEERFEKRKAYIEDLLKASNESPLI